MTNSNDKVQQACQLIDEMNTADLNEVIDHIRAVFKLKRQMENAAAGIKLGIGMRVMFNDQVRPQYLRGMTGHIDSRRQTKLVVTLEGGPTGKFRSGKVVTSAASLIHIPTDS